MQSIEETSILPDEGMKRARLEEQPFSEQQAIPASVVDVSQQPIYAQYVQIQPQSLLPSFVPPIAIPLPQDQPVVATEPETEEPEDDTPHCLCQTPYDGSLMICCDKCEKWFHPGCMGMSEDEAKTTDKWECPKCRGADEEYIRRLPIRRGRGRRRGGATRRARRRRSTTTIPKEKHEKPESEAAEGEHPAAAPGEAEGEVAPVTPRTRRTQAALNITPKKSQRLAEKREQQARAQEALAQQESEQPPAEEAKRGRPKRRRSTTARQAPPVAESAAAVTGVPPAAAGAFRGPMQMPLMMVPQGYPALQGMPPAPQQLFYQPVLDPQQLLQQMGQPMLTPEYLAQLTQAAQPLLAPGAEIKDAPVTTGLPEAQCALDGCTNPPQPAHVPYCSDACHLRHNELASCAVAGEPQAVLPAAALQYPASQPAGEITGADIPQTLAGTPWGTAPSTVPAPAIIPNLPALAPSALAPSTITPPALTPSALPEDTPAQM